MQGVMFEFELSVNSHKMLTVISMLSNSSGNPIIYSPLDYTISLIYQKTVSSNIFQHIILQEKSNYWDNLIWIFFARRTVRSDNDWYQRFKIVNPHSIQISIFQLDLLIIQSNSFQSLFEVFNLNYNKINDRLTLIGFYFLNIYLDA